MQWMEYDKFYTTSQSNELLAYTEGLNVVYPWGAITTFQHDLDPSIIKDKDKSTDVDTKHEEHLKGVDNMKLENSSTELPALKLLCKLYWKYSKWS